MDKQRQRDRYITLLGDPIHTGAIQSVLMSSDTKATGIATAFSAAVHSMFDQDPISALSNTLTGNIMSQAISRLFLERIILKRIQPDPENELALASKEMLAEICIDKAPDENTSLKSLTKYGECAKHAKLMYGFGIGFYAVSNTIGTAAAINIRLSQGMELSPSILNSHLDDVSSYTRMYSGYQRFNKVAKGEWAIVTTPEPEQVTSQDMAYTPT